MKELIVEYRGFGQRIPVGTLADNGKSVLFEYDVAAINAKLDLSPIRAPLRTLAYPDHQGDYRHLHDVPGFIYDSLPDGWGFRLMHRRMRAEGVAVERLSTLDHLAYLGQNTMGALVYLPPRGEVVSHEDLTLLRLAEEIDTVLSDDGYEVLAEMARVGASPGGARPKAMVCFNPATGALGTQEHAVPDGEPWLVKFAASDDAPDSCAVEEMYAQLARACGLATMPTHLFELPHHRLAFGTARFDRQDGQRTHVHSLAGLLHADFRVPSLGYVDLFRAVRYLTGDQRELVKALRLCVFNVLMNNRDDHAKNVAFIRQADDRWILAPPFDLTYSPGHRGEHFMDVNGASKAPGRSDILSAASAAGLPEKLAIRVLDEMLDVITPQSLRTKMLDFPLTRETMKTLASSLDANHARLYKRG
ncbi:type II toxin-antitoxin system HipA family toxin [Xanthomonas sp. NCPPB 2632]|uniref:type II toxin-antitoxin system HipA family toxin n=1 Tax=Xanthomonas sp. NCPPB 2632 TaxID=3240912 RepID=UPI003515C0C5